jgi:hypothetical protein
MYGAGNMTPFETHTAAARPMRMAAAPRTPAGWRAYVHMRRAWLIADDLSRRQRPSGRRATSRAPANP